MSLHKETVHLDCGEGQTYCGQQGQVAEPIDYDLVTCQACHGFYTEEQDYLLFEVNQIKEVA